MNKWPFFSRECRRDVDRVLRSGKLTAYKANGSCLGPAKGSEAYALEREIEKKFKVKHAVAVNSGTAALHAALMALDLKGREVIVPPFSFSATASAVLLAGGVPRFCDIDQHTFCLDPKEVKRVITKRTGAILTVNLFGYAPDLSPLLQLGVPVVEDACQSVGAFRDGKFSGTHGVAGALSFNGSKAIPTGEGGALVTNSDKIAESARLLMNHGCNFGWDRVGYNYRMHEVVAVLARHGLRALDVRNERRRELVVALDNDMSEWMMRNYEKELITLSMGDGSEDGEEYWSGLSDDEDYESHVLYVYPFRVKKGTRPRFIARCARRGLVVTPGYSTPLHRLPAFRKYQTAPLPVTEELHDKTLCLLTNLTPNAPLSEARRTAKIIREGLE